jgi:hypothetical protein
MDHAENTIPLLLFMYRFLVLAGYCESTVLALSKYATISTYNLITNYTPTQDLRLHAY